MFLGYTRYQPHGLSQAIPTLWPVTSHTPPINTYTHNSLACTVCTTRQAQVTPSHCLAFTYNSLHKAKRIHRGRDFQKWCCHWQFSLKIQTYLQKRPTENIFGQTTFKKWPKNAKRPAQKSYGQPTRNTAKFHKFWQNGRSRNPGLNDDEHSLKWMTMSILFLRRWELFIVTHHVWNKTPEFSFQSMQGQWGTP